MRTKGLALVLALTVFATPTAALALTGSTAVARGHRIVLFHSIGPVALGMTSRQVEHALGTPTSVERINGRLENLVFARRGLFIAFNRRARADTISTGNRADTTAKGIHPGSTRSQLLRAYPHIRRSWEGYHLIQHPARAPHSREVQFIVINGHVTTILLNRTVDY
jgi:hypothetical protein